MSQIYKLPSGKYRIQVYDEYGKRHRLTFDRKFDAEAYVRKIEFRKYEQSQVQQKLIKPKILIERAIAEFWNDKQSIRPKSWVKYTYELRQLQAFCDQRNIQFVNDFTREHADEYRQLLIKSDAAPKTINSYLSRLRAVFTEQVNRDNIIKNPTSHLRNVPLKRKTLLEREDEYYTESEIREFFKQNMHPAYRLAFTGLFLTGLRFEELANLTWDKVDFDKRMLKIRSTETFITKTPSAERDIPISDRLYHLLQGNYTARKSESVFPSVSGQKLIERSLLGICKCVAKDASITKNATLHKFRHTFNSLLGQYGVAYEVREYLMGHKPRGLSLTAHYTKLDPSKFHCVITILDKILKIEKQD